MTLTIELTPDLLIALEKQAEERGVSAEGLAQQVLANALAHLPEALTGHPPLQNDGGMLAKYSPAPSGEDVGSRNAELLSGFVSPTLRDLRQKIVDAGGTGMAPEYLDEEIRDMRRSSIG